MSLLKLCIEHILCAITGVTVALFASNCKKAGASDRYQYIEELMKYIPVNHISKGLVSVIAMLPLLLFIRIAIITASAVQ